MKKIYSVFGLIAFVLVFSGCKTAAKLYEKGNYDDAKAIAKNITDNQEKNQPSWQES